MQVNNNANITKLEIQTEVIKKSQDVAVNEIKDILEKNLDVKAEANKMTNTGTNLDIKA